MAALISNVDFFVISRLMVGVLIGFLLSIDEMTSDGFSDAAFGGDSRDDGMGFMMRGAAAIGRLGRGGGASKRSSSSLSSSEALSSESTSCGLA